MTFLRAGRRDNLASARPHTLRQTISLWKKVVKPIGPISTGKLNASYLAYTAGLSTW